MQRIVYFWFASIVALIFATLAFAQERTLDEIKAEAIKRAENGMYPLIGLDPADVKQAFAAIKTSDYDEWAAAFTAVGDRYIGGSQIARKIGSRKSQRRLHSRVAHLFVRPLARARFPWQAAGVCTSARSLSRAREIHGPASRSRAHPV